MAQEVDSIPEPVFYERGEDGYFHFFYDENYFLSDRDCSFRKIERVAQYNTTARVFDGEFVDYDVYGRVLLEGFYEKGSKEGLFTAYHPNGEVKWELEFEHGMPKGIATYYYPDGLPFFELEYGDEGVIIKNYWDNRGRQRVVNGNGRFEVTIKASGYNPSGYVFYERKGRLVNGRPHRIWTTKFIYGDGSRSDGGFEVMREGMFLRGFDEYEEWYEDFSRYYLFPVDPYIRAELMISKRCSIDDNSGFLAYLTDVMESVLVPASADDVTFQEIIYTLSVSKDGVPSDVKEEKIEVIDAVGNLLKSAIQHIPFWYPSFKDGEYIDDQLTIKAELFPDKNNDKIRFFNVNIERAEGI